MQRQSKRKLYLAALQAQSIGIAGLLIFGCLSSLSAAAKQPSFELDAKPNAASTQVLPRPDLTTAFDSSKYNPAILRISFSTARTATGDDFLDLVLIPPAGEPVGKRLNVNRKIFAENLRLLYAALSRQDSLDTDNPNSPVRYLYSLLIGPIASELQSAKITTLLIALESGLQAVPFSALHDGSAYFGETLAFSLTPSLSLMPLTAPSSKNGLDVSLGASVFEGLAPLPLTPQEINKVVDSKGGQYLNQAFSPQVLMQKVADSNVRRLHLATHAEFLPGGPSKARLFTGTGAMNLTAFSELRRKSGEPLLDLISLSACRTALGDPESELGFAGLALQAGARSAVGSLWYIDDVATSALFVLFYRYLHLGYPKAEALQATRQAFTSGQVHLDGDKLVGPGKQVLIQDLNRVQQRRVAEGLKHPFFWAGITLIGSPL